MRWWIVLVLVLSGCRRKYPDVSMTQWDGHPLSCKKGTLALRDIASPSGSSTISEISASGTCRLVIERSVLPGIVAITASEHAIVELRDVQLDGTLLAYQDAGVTATSVRPATANGNLTMLADGESVITIQKSHLRGQRPASGSTRGALVVVDSKLEGREKNNTQTAVYTWNSARVNVRGGEIIGQVIASGGGPLDLKPATWTSPTLDASKTLAYVRCLATTDVQLRKALADVAAGGAPTVSADWVRVCADEIARVAAMKPRIPARDDAAAAWAQQLLPIAGKLDQLRRYIEAGDNKDDEGARGKQLREQLATARVELEAASAAFAAISVPDRIGANAWWRQHAGTLEGAVIDMFVAAEELALNARLLDPASIAAALDVASNASTALFDLVADRTATDRVTSFWAEESGNATSWSALENPLRALHDEIKRVRRALLDAKHPVGLAELARIGELIALAHDHYARLKFPPPVESPVR